MNNEEKMKVVDLMEYLRVIIKRKWIIITFAGVIVFCTGVFSFLATPMYEAKASLLIEEGSSKILSIDETFGFRPQVVRDFTFFNTQLKLLTSRRLALRVAEKMKLSSHPEFGSGHDKKKSMLSSIKGLITFKWLKPRRKAEEKKSKSMVESSPFSQAASKIQRNVKVKPIRDTKLVEVSYTSVSPVLAAEVTNTLAEEFIADSLRIPFERTKIASALLDETIADLQRQLTEKQLELSRYGKEKDLDLSDTESTATKTYDELSNAYTQAKIDRINAESEFRALENLDEESLPQLVNNPNLQQVASSYTTKKTEYDRMRKIYKEDYPKMIQLKEELDSLLSELQKARDTAESEYKNALRKEGFFRSQVERQKRELAEMKSDSIHYNRIKSDMESLEKILNHYKEKLNETQVSAQLGSLNASNINIIDSALIPKGPVSPKKTQNLILALLIGLFGGVGLCFFLEYIDNTIKGPEDVERLVGLPSLGLIPYLPPEGLKKKKRGGYYLGDGYMYGEENQETEDILSEIKEIELVNFHYPSFIISEDYRTVRTSILLSHAENPPQTILFSSSSPREGKTTTAANMAVAFSQLEKKVLLVDSDLRKPKLHRIFKVRNIGGLTGFLTGKFPFDEAIQKPSLENIWLIPSGPIPPNPAELLNSKKMNSMIEQAKKRFDIVLIDAPPVLAVIDAVVTSSFVDSIVFVVQARKTERKPFIRAIEELRRAKANIIGIVFNEVKMKKGDTYYMDYYRYDRDYYAGPEI